MPPEPLPTDAELKILKILWQRGPSTVRDVHDELYGGTAVTYTTTLKLLQNMFAKQLVKRNEQQRQHIYSAAVTERRALSELVRRWADNLFGGSSATLAMYALESKHVSPEDLESLKAHIARLEAEERERK